MTLYYTMGTTNTAAALAMMRTDHFTSGHGDRSNMPNVGVIVTDGRSNDKDQTWREARNVC